MRLGWLFAGALLALVIFLPNLYWQTTHNWETFAFQFGRVIAGQFSFRFIFEFLAAQLGLASPFLFVLGAVGLVQARRERAGDQAFKAVDLPRAATLLAQGAGRLIRSSSDSGVVAVLDRRLATAGYGGVLRASLPPMRWTTDRRIAISFLEQAVKTPHEPPGVN